MTTSVCLCGYDESVSWVGVGVAVRQYSRDANVMTVNSLPALLILRI